MGKESKNPFAIKQSPVRIITAQAVDMDDIVVEACDCFAGGIPHVCTNSLWSGGK